jgi:hypothetical protein
MYNSVFRGLLILGSLTIFIYNLTCFSYTDKVSILLSAALIIILVELCTNAQLRYNLYEHFTNKENNNDTSGINEEDDDEEEDNEQNNDNDEGNMKYSELPKDMHKPLGDNISQDFTSQYSMLNTKYWDVPMPRPPVCIMEKEPCPVCPAMTKDFSVLDIDKQPQIDLNKQYLKKISKKKVKGKSKTQNKEYLNDY